MKILPLALVASLAVSALAIPSAANARPGWGKHHPHCTWVWRHHHRVRVCR